MKPEQFAVRLDDGRPVMRVVQEMTPGEVIAAIDLLGGDPAHDKLARLLRIVAEKHTVFGE